MIIGVDACPLVERRTGIGNLTYTLLEHLCRWKPQTRFILYSNAPIRFPKLPNVTFRELITRRRGALWHHTRLRRALLQDRVDLFWGSNGYLPARLPLEIGSIVTVHDLVWRNAGHSMPTLSYWSRRLFQPLAIRAAHSVIGVSGATTAEIRRHYGREVDAVIQPVVSRNFEIARNDEIERIRSKYDLRPGYLLAVGTLEPRKNYESLLHGYADARKANQSVPQLVIAGRRGWMDGPILDAIANYAEYEVRYLGFVPDSDMSALYSGAIALIQPSIYEGFGMPVVEAQLCGTPVLISDIPALTEASGGIATCFAPTRIGIRDAIASISTADLRWMSRLRTDIPNSVEHAAAKFWTVVETTLDRKRS